jgi:hypothetical protein
MLKALQTQRMIFIYNCMSIARIPLKSIQKSPYSQLNQESH